MRPEGFDILPQKRMISLNYFHCNINYRRVFFSECVGLFSGFSFAVDTHSPSDFRYSYDSTSHRSVFTGFFPLAGTAS